MGGMDTDTPRTAKPGHITLPRRSRADRKIAGVAGGLGRALGVDPILIRVAFVVLALFGGSGVLLYCIGWLVMPADGDDASAVQALAGRGRSSVSPALAVVLVIVALASAGSVFSWGVPFWPVAIAAGVVFVLLARGRAMRCRSRTWTPPADWGRRADWRTRADWSARADEFGERVSAWGNRVGEHASRWADQWGTGRPGRASESDAMSATAPNTAHDDLSGHAPAPGDAPASADAYRADADPAHAPAGTMSGVDDAASGAPEARTPSPEELLSMGRRTPPAWDPLGAAPFAWDLPEPGPDPAQPAGAGSGSVAARAGRAGGSAIGRLFLGLALLTGGSLAAGVLLGWWSLYWSAITGITLAVVGVGLIVASLRGVGGRHLIGPGIFLALLTLGLTVTGISGTHGFGAQTWTPTLVTDVQTAYSWTAGQATLDLSDLKLPLDRSVTTSVALNAGQVTVIVPSGVTVDATCYSRLGAVDCLGSTGSGVRTTETGHQNGEKSSGSIKLDVQNNAGQVVVRHG
ncbi:MAG: hypothetical protein BGO26_03485 [Actinobacteria bacterium 69-20]|nr:MAG: hypothetical protein BGO26_03485 [Actinobacteria bacterium 69-20]